MPKGSHISLFLLEGGLKIDLPKTILSRFTCCVEVLKVLSTQH